jgi:hypothetical protein
MNKADASLVEARKALGDAQAVENRAYSLLCEHVRGERYCVSCDGNFDSEHFHFKGGAK